MKKAVNIFLLGFYLFGTICLPIGDFLMLADIREMYHHCQATEDKDMTPLDFITDHLINIDGIFDHRDNGDDQQPHHPLPGQKHHGHSTFFFVSANAFSLMQFHHIEEEQIGSPDCLLPSGCLCSVFRPPVMS